MNKCIWLFLIAVVTISACKKEEDQSGIDEQIIIDYLEANNITEAIRHETGVYYWIEEEGDGSGIYPDISSTVRANYRGTLVDGTEFDSNFGDVPTNFPLEETISGWQIGMPFFEKGSKGWLYIPSSYGYGRQGRGSIPPNAVLVFEVEIINVFN